MRNFKSFFLLLFMVGLFASCAKTGTYTCECVMEDNQGSDPITTEAWTTKGKKSDLQELCENSSSTSTSGDLTVTTTCQLKD